MSILDKTLRAIFIPAAVMLSLTTQSIAEQSKTIIVTGKSAQKLIDGLKDVQELSAHPVMKEGGIECFPSHKNISASCSFTVDGVDVVLKGNRLTVKGKSFDLAQDEFGPLGLVPRTNSQPKAPDLISL